jgi:hypothetical protein
MEADGLRGLEAFSQFESLIGLEALELSSNNRVLEAYRLTGCLQTLQA